MALTDITKIKILKMIPWGQIISASVTMADLAHSLYKQTKKGPKIDDPTNENTSTLLQRIETLESIQLEQSNLLQQMTLQNKILIKKVRNAYVMTAVALFISISLVILYVFTGAL